MKTRRQREVIRDVMLSASNVETWLTLDELAKLTHYPPASISAQLRGLRGDGYKLEKRIRTSDVSSREWEYQLRFNLR